MSAAAQKVSPHDRHHIEQSRRRHRLDSVATQEKAALAASALFEREFDELMSSRGLG